MWNFSKSPVVKQIKENNKNFLGTPVINKHRSWNVIQFIITVHQINLVPNWQQCRMLDITNMGINHITHRSSHRFLCYLGSTIAVK